MRFLSSLVMVMVGLFSLGMISATISNEEVRARAASGFENFCSDANIENYCNDIAEIQEGVIARVLDQVG